MTIEKLSSPLLEFSPTLVIESHGRFLILRTTDFRRTEKESSLRDVLEENVDPKYFLSGKAMEGILRRYENGALLEDEAKTLRDALTPEE